MVLERILTLPSRGKTGRPCVSLLCGGGQASVCCFCPPEPFWHTTLSIRPAERVWCSDSSATPSFPSQPEGKIGLPRANPRAPPDRERRVDSPALSARGSRPSPCTSDEAVSRGNSRRIESWTQRASYEVTCGFLTAWGVGAPNPHVI